jgi:hypothetical protein
MKPMDVLNLLPLAAPLMFSRMNKEKPSGGDGGQV